MTLNALFLSFVLHLIAVIFHKPTLTKEIMKRISRLVLFSSQFLVIIALTGCSSTEFASTSEAKVKHEEIEMTTGSNFLKKTGRSTNSAVREVDKDSIVDSLKSQPMPVPKGGG